MSENGEPLTPREIAQYDVERTVRDAWLAVTEMNKLYADPLARPFFASQSADIWSLKTKVDLLASAMRQPELRAVS